jgi:pSer/pThr/pTyr-binding forkhead associated (FHA) protein
VTCERCGRANAGTASYCQYCGQVLITSPPIASGSALLCGGCGAENPPGTNFCYACGRRLRMTSASGGNDVGHLPLRARLVAVRRDGTDGASYPFEGDQLDIGRSEGDLLFEDPHLASRHARILRRGGGYVLVPLDTRNGVYVRVTVPTPLDEGDQILLGKQVLRFEVVPDVERNLRPGVEQGVILFGTPVRAPWARLRQMTSAGTTRDVYHLARSEVILGREQGDIVFSDDEFMSRRHAALRARPGGGEVEDAGSSNGTFIRLRREHFLGHGEMIRLGDELLRFELL